MAITRVVGRGEYDRLEDELTIVGEIKTTQSIPELETFGVYTATIESNQKRGLSERVDTEFAARNLSFHSVLNLKRLDPSPAVKMTNSTDVSDMKMTRFGYRVDLIRGRHVRVKNDC